MTCDEMKALLIRRLNLEYSERYKQFMIEMAPKMIDFGGKIRFRPVGWYKLMVNIDKDYSAKYYTIMTNSFKGAIRILKEKSSIVRGLSWDMDNVLDTLMSTNLDWNTRAMLYIVASLTNDRYAVDLDSRDNLVISIK